MVSERKSLTTKLLAFVKHFIDDCNDPHLSFKYLGFLIIDVLNNADDSSENDFERLLLQKVNFWIGALVTQHWQRTFSYAVEDDAVT